MKPILLILALARLLLAQNLVPFTTPDTSTDAVQTITRAYDTSRVLVGFTMTKNTRIVSLIVEQKIISYFPNDTANGIILNVQGKKLSYPVSYFDADSTVLINALRVVNAAAKKMVRK
jgi:hypothetical protein